MKPAPFAYHRPARVDEALALLAEHGFDAKVIAGGQSLAPMMNMRFAQPAHLIDLNGLAELSGLECRGDMLRIGAMTRHHVLATSAEVRQACPLLADAACTVAHYAIRQRGTLGGSLANADPAAQLALVARTLEARIHVRGPAGDRELAAADFFLGAMATALNPDEIILAVSMPCLQAGEGHAFELFSRRHGDFAIASCAVTARLDGGRFQHVRIGIGGVADTPVLLGELGLACAGQAADAAAIARIAELAAAAVDPVEQPGIEPAFRRDLVKALTARALARACGHKE